MRVAGVEPASYPWEGYIIAVIRYPRGADDGDRTCDLLVTNELLYQLSYIGVYQVILPFRTILYQAMK